LNYLKLKINVQIAGINYKERNGYNSK